MMSCTDLSAVLEPYIDGEVDEVDAVEIEGHINGCESCCAELERRASLKEGLRALANEHALSDGFRSQMDSMLTLVPEREATRPAAPRTAWMAAAAAVMVVGTAGVTYAITAPSTPEPPMVVASAYPTPPVTAAAVDESVRWHSRPVPIEVTGPDGVEVGEWFRGKVDFPVSPPNFARRANLLGGRLGNVSDHEAAVLVYDVEGTKLSVMMYEPENDIATGAPSPTELPYYVGERNGYNVAFHEHDGVAYTFTTNLPDAELRSLVNVAFSY